MAIKIKDRLASKFLAGEIYTLNTEDPLGAFHSAVRNGQTRLAVEYASIIINDLLERVETLESAMSSVEVVPEVEPTVAKKAPARKTVKATAAVSEVAVSLPEEDAGE